MENNACQCRTNSSSACSTLDQQTFVNLTGASNESASQWTCCLCPLNTTYCCDKCQNISISPVTGKEKVSFFLFFFCFVLQREISYRVGVVLKNEETCLAKFGWLRTKSSTGQYLAFLPAFLKYLWKKKKNTEQTLKKSKENVWAAVKSELE